MKLFSLQNRVAMVTGAGRGIGKALALGLAEAGADVICLSRTAAEVEVTAGEVRAMGRRALALTADITVKEQVERAVETAVGEFDKIDILVNNAGMNIRKPALDVTEDDWEKVIATNLRGPFFVAQAVGRVMAKHGYGRVINISSVGGEVALRTGVPYGAAKAGLQHMTRVLALEWAKYGINVNALGPWYFRTSLTEGVLKDEKYVAEILARTPLKRIGEVGEMVGPVIFLASEASSYMTGQVMMVDGGMTIYGF